VSGHYIVPEFISCDCRRTGWWIYDRQHGIVETDRFCRYRWRV